MNLYINFETVDGTLGCDYSNESYCAVLLCGTYYPIQGGSWF